MATFSPLLSERQLDFFHEQGYLVVDDVIPPGDLQPVIDEITAEIDTRARKLVEMGHLEHPYAQDGFLTRLAKISQKTDHLALSIWNGILHGPAIFHLITHPRLIDVAEQLCGPEVIASSVYRLRPKIPNYGYGAVPWHQDSGYFEPYCDKGLVLTVWITLVDACEENGCMWVIPGSHKGKVVPHVAAPNGKYLKIPEDHLPQGKHVCCPVAKGGVLLLHNRVAHASFLNKTDGVRWSMDLRYQSAALPTTADIARLPGEAVESKEMGVPAACYPPEADFLVRSKKRPDEVLKTYEQFNTLRSRPTGIPVTNRWGVHWAEPEVNLLV